MSANDPLGGLGNLLGEVTGASGSGELPAGLGDAIGGLLGGVGGGTGSAGLEDLVRSFKDAGLERQVESWIARGPNQPVTADEIGTALGPERVQQLASSTGIDVGQLLPMLAAFLPKIIDALTPNGRLPQPGEPVAAGGPMDALGGIVKGLGG